SPRSGLGSGVGLQEQQGALLLQFGKQLPGPRVIGFEAGGELIDQARLHADQAILITDEQFELSELLTVCFEALQIAQVSSSALGQQVGTSSIRLGTRCGSSTIDGARIDRL